MTRILIADDHELVRRGLREILADSFEELAVGEAVDGRQTLEIAATQSWDVVLLDINMPGRGGLDVLQDLKRHYPRLPVIVLSAFSERDFALRAFKLGAAGFISKQSLSGELIAAVHKALAGSRYVTSSLAEALAANLAGEDVGVPHEMLSNRELQVLRLVGLGKPLKQIALELALSEKTVATYRTRLGRKLRLSTNVELARYATHHKLID